jgi:dTDP-glucose 4,6-dehydratase
VADLVQLVGELLGKPLTVVADPERIRPEASELERLVSDPSRARESIGWEPEVDLREGLRRTIEWLRTNPEKLRPDEYVT